MRSTLSIQLVVALAGLSFGTGASAGPSPGLRQLDRLRDSIAARARTSPSWPDLVACPRCGAEAGQRCDRRTLGRHSFHLARVDLARASSSPPPPELPCPSPTTT